MGRVPSPTASPIPCSQHVVFSIGRVLDLLVPDIPESVQIKVKREYYLAKQALAENEVSPSLQPSHTHRGGSSQALCYPADQGKASSIPLLGHPPWTQALFGTNGAKDDQPSASEESLGPQPRCPEASRASPVPSV